LCRQRPRQIASPLQALRAPRSTRTSVYTPWAMRLARTVGVDSLLCPRCRKGRLRPIAVITKEAMVSKILAHLRLPVSPELLADACTIVYDVTDQPIPGWVAGAEPEPPEQEARGPPCDGFEGIDPPCPEDCAAGTGSGTAAFAPPRRRRGVSWTT
jgi:hypothetical protein